MDGCLISFFWRIFLIDVKQKQITIPFRSTEKDYKGMQIITEEIKIILLYNETNFLNDWRFFFKNSF